jgi:hypothetical protein
VVEGGALRFTIARGDHDGVDVEERRMGWVRVVVREHDMVLPVREARVREEELLELARGRVPVSMRHVPVDGHSIRAVRAPLRAIDIDACAVESE